MLLQEKRDALVEFVYLLEDSLGYMTRMLLEHYSETEIDKPFLDKFSKYLGRFDWMSKRVEYFRNKSTIKDGHVMKPPPFQPEIISRTTELIKKNEVQLALDLLLSNVQNKFVEKDLTVLNQRWLEFVKNKRFRLRSDDSLDVSMNQIVDGILSIIIYHEQSLPENHS